MASGIAPAAYIASYKVLWLVNGQGVGVVSDLTAAIDDAVADGCDVLSLSLGGQYMSYFDDIALLNAAKVSWCGVNNTLCAHVMAVQVLRGRKTGLVSLCLFCKYSVVST